MCPLWLTPAIERLFIAAGAIIFCLGVWFLAIAAVQHLVDGLMYAVLAPFIGAK